MTKKQKKTIDEIFKSMPDKRGGSGDGPLRVVIEFDPTVAKSCSGDAIEHEFEEAKRLFIEKLVAGGWLKQPKQKKKTIDERIEEFLWWGDGFGEISRAIKTLISDIISEIVGRDEKNGVAVIDGEKVDVVCKEWTGGYNQAKQEIRQRAKELGLEIWENASKDK